MLNEKIGNKEAVIFIVTIIINSILLNANKIIIKDCKSSSIINAIYISIIAIIIVLLICKLFKNFPGYSILDISKFLGGKPLQFIVGIIYISYLGFITAILLRKLCDCLQIIFYPMTDLMFIIFLFVIAAAITVRLDKGSIFRTTLIIFPVLALVIIVAFIGNSKNFNFENIYPLLGNGVEATFKTGFTNLFAFTGLSYLYFLPSYLSNPQKFKKISCSSIIIASFFLILMTANILFMYSDSLSSSELFPLYIAVRYIEFGSFIQRMDSTFLLICALSFISYLSLNTTICTNIFKKITNISDNKPIIYPYLLCIFSVAVMIKNNSVLDLIENNIFKILFFSISIILCISILILANIKKIFKKGDVKH